MKRLSTDRNHIPNVKGVSYDVEDKKAMRWIGVELGEEIDDYINMGHHPRVVVVLRGDIGAGKTFLVKKAVKEMTNWFNLYPAKPKVIDPKFTVFEQCTFAPVVSHIDLFGLKAHEDFGAEPLEKLFRDMTGGKCLVSIMEESLVTFIEWPNFFDGLYNILPEDEYSRKGFCFFVLEIKKTGETSRHIKWQIYDSSPENEAEKAALRKAIDEKDENNPLYIRWKNFMTQINGYGWTT